MRRLSSGRRAIFDGEDIINIICQQEATARFIARHMYHFFVADEPPVPAWPYTPPRDEDAINLLAQAYFDSGYDITEMLRVLFNSDFFKAEDARYEKVKGPAEFAVGVLRMTREFDLPNREMINRFRQINWMGQELNNPPSVEGWHQGVEWIDTGTLMERINFASEQLGDLDKPGVRDMVDSIVADGIESNGSRGTRSELMVSRCLEQMGALSVSDGTREALLGIAEQDGDERENVAQMLRLTAASKEFQRL